VRLTYIGRLSPRKGTDLVITAAAELVDDGVDVEVDILGEVFEGYEWYAEALRNTVAERGLGSRVRFLGSRDDVWIALQLADIVVIPSPVGEPFGNTAVEAALAARPLVVSESSGLLEATVGLAGSAELTARVEQVQKSGDELGFLADNLTQLFTVRSASLAATRDVWQIGKANIGAGARVNVALLPQTLELTYQTRTPTGFAIYVRLR